MVQRGFNRLSGAVWAAATLSLAVGVVAPTAAQKSSEPVPVRTAERFASKTLPLIKTHCLSCHSGESAQGGVRFDLIREARQLLDDTQLWDRALINLRNQTMPPARSKMPTEAERMELITGIHTVLLAESRPEDPGRVTVRRLNRFEYGNTVRDLLGVDLHPEEDFPSDDVGYGFDNIGDVLSLSPLHLDGYLRAAEKLVAEALPGRRSASAKLETEKFQVQGGVNLRGGQLVFFSNGTAGGELVFPKRGRYALRFSAHGTQAGGDLPRLIVSLDGQGIDAIDLRGSEENPVEYELQLETRQGRARLDFAFVNDFYDPNHPDAGRRDRNAFVNEVHLVGPIGDASNLTPLQRELAPTLPGAGQERAAAQRSLRPFAEKAYRRPLTEDEFRRIMGLYDRGLRQGGHDQGLRLAVTGMLVSPSFLFRTEAVSGSGPAGDLNGWQLAARLSYFLWGTLPDAELRRVAADGTLTRPEVLEAQAMRMLKDSRSNALADSFAMQWLELGRLQTRLPDPKLFPDWSDGLRKDMVEETRLFFLDIMRRDASITDFLTAKHTFLNARLARLYGVGGVTGDEFRRVSLEGTPRSGLLTQAGILTVTSNPTRTSPVKRGKWVLDVILGAPPPPPPPGVADLVEKDEPGQQPLTVRDRTELHREDPACAGCHAKMDPIGFGLENFDGIGRWREKDGSMEIDASGKLPGGVKFDGPEELVEILVGRSDELARTFAERLSTYALGRGMRNADRGFLDSVVQKAQREDLKFSAFVRAIVSSDAFRRTTLTPDKKP
ncbi:MAG: DUF1592 domain-containing protein [Fimbriimonadaceae bacterium]|nr:DUF1592 domain-containing protein [Fimbriimonadaceae bacterium]